MSAPAAFSGSYADLRMVKSRKVVQVVVEIPIEAGAAFVAAFGMPNPEAEIPVALARLDAKKAAPAALAPAGERRPFRTLPYAQQAALACADPVFRAFLRENDMKADSEDDAAVCVRMICGVQSRADIRAGAPAAAKWDDLYGRFQGWRAAA